MVRRLVPFAVSLAMAVASLGAAEPSSTFDVAFKLDPSGKVVIVPAQSAFHANGTFQATPKRAQDALKQQWNAFLTAALANQSPLFEHVLTDTERTQLANGTLPQSTMDEIAKLLKGTGVWADALPTYNQFAREHRNRRGGEAALEDVLNLVVNVNFLNGSPLSHLDLDKHKGTATFQVSDLIQDFEKQVPVTIKEAPADLQPRRTPITKDWVYHWLNEEQKRQVWVASVLKQRLTDAIAAIGLQPDVSPSRAGEPLGLTIDVQLVHLIRMPGDLDPAKPATAVEILKILSVLLPAEDYSAVLRTGVDNLVTASGSGALASQDLDLAKVRVEKGLFYLDLFQFPVQQAALQEAGYVVSTENEPGDDTSLATTLILNVGRPLAGAPPKPPSAPDAKPTASPAQKKPVTTAAGAQALAPITGNPVTPETPRTPTPAIEKPHFTFGAGVQYRSGQGIRPLISASTNALPVPWGSTSLQGATGTENTNPIGSLNWQNDYIAFAKLHHRLSFSLAGKTDSKDNRLLGSNSETNVRRTGGQGRLEYDAINDGHGVYVQLFGQGARDNLAFSRSGASIPNVSLWTADAGATIDILHEARPFPGRFEITPQVHIGDQSAALTKPYTVLSLDVMAHQRISDIQLISTDFAAHFRDATRQTPIFELPALGGGDSLRGFRPDDALERRYWSLQSELWMPLPGTLSALPGGHGIGGVRWFLRQNIRLALFADVAGAYQIPSTVPATFLDGAARAVVNSGIRWAPGLGVRVVRGNFALKLDWAYGRGRGQSGAGHGRTDMGVVQNGAF